MHNLLKKIKERIPLYEISRKIKQPYLDAYDKRFYKQIRFCNIVASIVYTLIVAFEIMNKISDLYLIFDIIFVVVGFFVLIGVGYAHYSQKIWYNYWLCVIFILRINLGLIQYTFVGSARFSDSKYALIWGYNSYTACDALLYLINNVSHQNKMLAPVLCHLFSVFSLFYFLFFFLGRPNGILEWFLVLIYGACVISSVIYKLILQKFIQEQILLSLQTKQESKEYILDVLQEGIMIISQKFDKKKINRNQNENQIEIIEQNYNVNFMNSYLKKIVDIPLVRSQNQDSEIIQDLMNQILNKEILEENMPREQASQQQPGKNQSLNQQDENQNQSKGRKIQYSIKKLLQLDYTEIEKKIFSLISLVNSDQIRREKCYIQIKIHKSQFDDHNEITIQIIDISLNIINEKIKFEIDLESQIRGWCCHEFRNPLNSILNATELIESYLDEVLGEQDQIVSYRNEKQRLSIKEKLQKNLKILTYSSKMLKFFVQDMLDFQILRGDKIVKDITQFNIREAINEVIQMQEFTAQKIGVRVSIDYRHKLFQKDPNCLIQTDCSRLQQILLNLYTNALKYSNKGGQIKIIVDIIQPQIENAQTNQLIKISVWDNGLGISAQDQNKIFKLFGTIENEINLNNKGIGLGLYNCKMIAKQFEGDITVESELGIGSIFTFTMAISEEKIFEKQSSYKSNQFIIRKSTIKQDQNNIENLIILKSQKQEEQEIELKEDIEIDLSDSHELNDDLNQEILTHQMEEIIKDLTRPPDQQIRNEQDKNFRIQRNNNSLEEPEFFKVLEQNQYSRIRKKVGTFFNIPNENNKIEIIQNNQKIRKKFRLQRKQDLLKQIAEFKNKPLIDIDEFKTNKNKYYQKNQIEINIKKELEPIKNFYKNIDNIIDPNVNDEEIMIEQYLNDFQRQKTLIITEQRTNNMILSEHESGLTERQHFYQQEFTENQYSFAEQNDQSPLQIMNNQDKIADSILSLDQEHIFDIEKIRFIKVDKEIQKMGNFPEYHNKKEQSKIQQDVNNVYENENLIKRKSILDINQELKKIQKRGPRIMIVDDSYFNIEIMKDVMQQVLKIDVDRDVVEANNGKEAVIKYIELHKEFQVCPIQIILMDCDMPVMNGFRATEFILKFANEQLTKIGNDSNFKIPFIAAVTGDDNKKQQALAKKAGMNIMLPKPISSKELYQLLKFHKIFDQ